MKQIAIAALAAVAMTATAAHAAKTSASKKTTGANAASDAAATAAPKSAAAHATEGFKLISSGDLDKMMHEPNSSVAVFDANNNDTRSSDGLIPGAKPLERASAYDAALLPANKSAPVVFYCYNEQCMASHDAAKVAVKAGYTNVNVMSDGITGWKKAGKPTEKWNGKKS